ncbi:MAG: hypothetical protein RQ990_06980 [Candidatus Hydrothermia bacterium]|jgi:hypothetical protein|nr:hypothetical protein [Candidatus Hydrothermia bacterium]
MKELDKAIENYLKLAGLDWIIDYMKVKEVSEKVLKCYNFIEFEDFRNGDLILKVNDKRKIMEFHYKKMEIIRAINTIIGKKIVNNIILK